MFNYYLGYYDTCIHIILVVVGVAHRSLCFRRNDVHKVFHVALGLVPLLLHLGACLPQRARMLRGELVRLRDRHELQHLEKIGLARTLTRGQHIYTQQTQTNTRANAPW